MSVRGNESRRLIPLWRKSDDSRQLATRQPHSADEPPSLQSASLKRLEREWSEVGRESRGVALELLSVAVAEGADSKGAREAGSWLLSAGGLLPLAEDLASGYLEYKPFEDGIEIGSKLQIYASIALLRQRLSDDPRNALALSESARLYTMLGQIEKAQSLLERALSLHPDDRFFLRATSRFWVHVGDKERAQKLLRSRSRTLNDPWLLSAEISISSLTERPSRNLKAARRMLDAGRWSPSDLSELAGAVGTVDLVSEKKRHARRLFEFSIEAPNDNSLAQAEWAARKLPPGFSEELSEAEGVAVPGEAAAIKAETAGDHSAASTHAREWVNDQAFSTLPAVFGSYHAAISKDFEASFQFAESGLLANPHSPKLLNNAAFALAKSGQHEKARRYFNQIRPSDYPANEGPIYLATEALIAMRSGDQRAGIDGYRRAIETASNAHQKAVALLMFATELSAAGSPDASEVVAEARDSSSALPSNHRAWVEHLPKP